MWAFDNPTVPLKGHLREHNWSRVGHRGLNWKCPTHTPNVGAYKHPNKFGKGTTTVTPVVVSDESEPELLQ